MPSFSVRVSGAPGFWTKPTVDQLRAIGEVAVSTVKARWNSGVDINDQAAKALVGSYAKYKSKIGANPVRNMRLSGKTVAALKVIGVTENSVTIGFTNTEALKRMLFNQNIDPMFGLSPKDLDAVNAKVIEVVSENIRAQSVQNVATFLGR